MSNFRTTKIYGINICLDDNVYEPAEDSEMLLSIIKVNNGEKVIEIGSGSGILSVLAARMKGIVSAVDINPYASLVTLCTAKLNNVDINIVNCDMLECFRDIHWDVAIFNPPYLPVEEYNSWIEYSWSGGKIGSEVLVRFLNKIQAKRVYTIYSSLDNEEIILRNIKKRGFIVSKKVEKVIGFEELIALELYDKSCTSRARRRI
ncbi:HemK2/MTQ2 family protein methyltransferase [Acidianus brierleyi]|uniref:Methyltransferase n=1 Tax=Acidianus brierleyi TaxID=41673 RepID=A0A2U9IEJ8_9CREN|nr:HemK2/MTQ2 family protein methyltransferase [Acidianus brierleyi]AWR94425.1 methyltransferase [Acidianus brierleyi]